jgi:hypothetical protein
MRAVARTRQPAREPRQEFAAQPPEPTLATQEFELLTREHWRRILGMGHSERRHRSAVIPDQTRADVSRRLAATEPERTTRASSTL